MRLYFTTSAFRLNGLSYPDFPVLVREDGTIVREAQSFFVAHCIRRGRVESRQSWKTYGQDLYDYLSFCEANGLDWMKVDTTCEETALVTYRDWALSREVGNKPNTVNGRLRTAIRFYRHALKKGFVRQLPTGFEEIRVPPFDQFLAHTNVTSDTLSAAEVVVKERRVKIRVLSTQQAADLVNATRNPTHRLIVRLSLGTGLRREELASFPAKYVIDPAGYTRRKSFIRITCSPKDMRLKGGQERDIDIPRALMADLWHYKITTRNELQQLSGETQEALFLTSDGLAYAGGGGTLLQIVKEAGRAAGVPHANVHILRHTYATHTLFFLRKRKCAFDPLIYVRDRLGHASVSTTEKYLHLMSEVEDDVSNAYQEEVDRLTREAANG